MRVTLISVNDRLTELGRDARLEKGDGYFYSPAARQRIGWDRTVRVPILSNLTLDEWVDEFTRLKKLNEGMLLPPVKKKGR